MALYGNQTATQNFTGYNAMANGALSWDAPVDASQLNEEKLYINLQPGYYDAQIDYLEKGMHGNTGKIGECPMVTIHAHIDSQEGRVEISDRLYLHNSTALGISLFLQSCGVDLNGKTYGQAFDECNGRVARVEIQDRPYTNRNGEAKTLHNDVKRWVRRQPQQAYPSQTQAQAQPINQPIQPVQPQAPTYPQQPATVNDVLALGADDLPF